MTWPGNRAHLGEQFFPPTTSLGFLGKSPVFRSNTFLKLSGTEGGVASGKVCSWLHIWSSGAKQHDHAEHHEDVPQGDDDPEVPEAQ